MRILKDKIFNRKRAFNLVQLIDFICTRLDAYYERRLLDICGGKNDFILKRYDCESHKYNTCNLRVEQVNENTFKVVNDLKKTEYTVDIDIEICSCYAGFNGAPCKHQCAVLKTGRAKTLTKNFYLENENQRKLLHFIATNSNDVPDEWYKELRKETDRILISKI